MYGYLAGTPKLPPQYSVSSVVTGIVFVIMFIVMSAGFAQVDGLERHAGLFQRITLTTCWIWRTVIALYMLTAPSEVSTAERNQYKAAQFH